MAMNNYYNLRSDALQVAPIDFATVLGKIASHLTIFVASFADSFSSCGLTNHSVFVACV